MESASSSLASSSKSTLQGISTSGTSRASATSQTTTGRITQFATEQTTLFLAFFTKYSFAKAQQIFLIISFIHLFSATLDPAFGWAGGKLNIVNRIFRFLRTFNPKPTFNSDAYLGFSVVIIMILSVGLTLCIFFFIKVEHRFEKESGIVKQLSFLIELISGVFYIPILNVMLSSIACEGAFGNCEDASGSTLILTIINVVFLTPLVLFVKMFQFDFLATSKSVTARSRSTTESFCLILSIFLSFMAVLFTHVSLNATIARIIIGSVTLIGAIGGIFLEITCPFHYRWNTVYAIIGGFAVTALSGICSIVNAIVEFPTVLMIVFLVGIIPVFILSFFFGKKIIQIKWFSTYETTVLALSENNDEIQKEYNSSETSDYSDTEDRILSVHQFMMVISHYFWDCLKDKNVDMAHIPSEWYDKAGRVLLPTLQNLHSDRESKKLYDKNGALLELCYAVFLLHSPDDAQLCSVHMNRANSFKPSFANSVLLRRVNMLRKEIVRVRDNGAEETEAGFREADKHAQKCFEALKEFALNISSTNISGLNDCIAKYERAKNSAISVFERLRAKFPKSPAVLRRYAVFMRDVLNKNDQCVAMEEFANLLEEIHHSQGKRRSKAQPKKKLSQRLFKKNNQVAPFEGDIELLETKRKDQNDNGYDSVATSIDGSVPKGIQNAQISYSKQSIADNVFAQLEQDNSFLQLDGEDLIKDGDKMKESRLNVDSSFQFTEDESERDVSLNQPKGTPVNDRSSLRNQVKQQLNVKKFNQHAQFSEQVSISSNMKEMTIVNDGKMVKDDQETLIANAQKLSWYHAQIDSFKSGIFFYLKLVVVIGIVLVIVCNLITFAVVHSAFSSVQNTYTVLAEYSVLRSNILAAVSETETMEISLSYGNSGIIKSSQSRLDVLSDTIYKAYHSLYERADSNVLSLLNDRSQEVSVYFPETDIMITESTSLDAVIGESIRAGRSIARKTISNDVKLISKDKDVRYLQDNVGIELLNQISAIEDEYRRSTVTTANTYIYILCILVPVALTAVTVIVVLLFLYAIRLVRHEKVNVLQLFFAISHEEIMKLYRVYGGDHEKETGNRKKNRMGVQLHGFARLRNLELKLRQVQINGMKPLLIRGSVLLGTLAGLAILMWIYGVITLGSSYSSIDLVKQRGRERMLLMRMNVLVKSGMLDNKYVINRNDALKQFDEAKEEYLELVIENDSFSAGKNLEFSSAEVENLRMYRNCSSLIIGVCRGYSHVNHFLFAQLTALRDMNLFDLKASFEKGTSSLFGTVDDRRTKFEPWLLLDHGEQSTARNWSDSYMRILANSFVDRISGANTVVLSVFIVAWPAALIVFIAIMIPLFRIENEHTNTIKLLSLIPIGVIENTSEIRDFLVTKELTSIEEKMNTLLVESREKAEGILQAAADAIISFDKETLMIDVFNSTAERMFGYSRDEIAKQSIGLLIEEEELKKRARINEKEDGKHEDESDENHDVFATAKDGSKFPVTLSMSKKATGGQYVLFIRDLRELKGYQQLIENNDTLLFKMLPHSIALRIKNTIGENEDIKLADKHDEVTVMFADIDKFTNHTAGMDPQEIAELLNALVTKWDKLAMQYGIEKIKTIGDIYMAVSNCPDKSTSNHAVAMVQFCESLIRSLADFNKENNTDIHVRVGVNTGSVVGGVLGLSKVTYDIWGAAVNYASRMQSSGIIDTIQVTTSTYDMVKDDFPFVCRGDITVKGNIVIKAFIYNPIKPEAAKALIRKEALINEEKASKESQKEQSEAAEKD